MKCRNCKHPRWAEEYPGRPFFGWCDEINDSPDLDIERECRCFEPATNADRIRSMSDEELAEFISRIEIGDFGPQVCGKTFCDMCKGQYECDDCRLWWLQQPAEEEDT